MKPGPSSLAVRSTMRRMRTALVLVAALLSGASLRAAPPIQITSVVWKDAAGLPAGAKMAILEGDPTKPGLFTIRIKVPPGTKIMPHTHPRAERVTVLWGEVRVGFGDRFDLKKMKTFPAGSYYVNPPDSRHFLYFPRTTVLQMTGDGPWELHYARE